MDCRSPAPLCTGFSRQEYWSGLPFPSPGDLPDSGIEPMSPALAGRFFTTKPPGKPIKGNLGKLKIKIEEIGIYGRYIGWLALTY